MAVTCASLLLSVLIISIPGCLAAKHTYQSNSNALLTSFSHAANQSTTPGFYHTTVANYLCRGDVTGAACRDCVNAAASALPGKCPRGKQAVVWYDQCINRYSNESFLGRLDTANKQGGRVLFPNCNLLYQLYVQGRPKGVDKRGYRLELMEKETQRAHGVIRAIYYAPSPPIGAGATPLLLPTVPPKSTTGTAPAYLLPIVAPTPAPAPRDGPRPPPAAAAAADANQGRHHRPGKGRNWKPPSDRHLPGIISGSVLGVLMLLLTFTIALWFYVQQKKAKRALEDVRDILTAESLQMEFNTIRTATHNFAADRKLGQGGFGEVYKGTLENGQDIAVKRLSEGSGQGAAEFKTEVLLVAKLQHRNLVKLLGFCVSGKEKILVYEYLPNSSLDRFLFDPTKRVSLTWETRFKIIHGIARGLLYLHEDSRLKIVHRDLKTSNILLDEAMNPKIADFGLAKLFGVDQTQDATNTIVGTYGYMAPEYILTGHYSVKSDVYTLGIIVLELVSGQRNKYLNRSHLEEALLHRAWRLWTEDEALKLVDETLGDNYSVEEVIKCTHIGLLCIQENAVRRPTMTSVVAALGGQSIKLPSPTPPNFLAPAGRGTSGSNPAQPASIYTTSDISILDPR